MNTKEKPSKSKRGRRIKKDDDLFESKESGSNFQEQVAQKVPEKEELVEVREKQEISREEKTHREPLLVITGACGFIGSHAVEIAKKEGWRVRACDLPSAFRGKDELGKSRYPELVKRVADETAEVDITKPETIRGVFDDADYIFHIAAILKYDVPWELLYNVNVLGTRNVFEEILKSKNSNLKRVVVWSTNGIYGVPKDREITTEDSPVRPVTKYALSKFLEEKTAFSYYKNYGIPVTVIKPTAVYGPRESYMFYDYLKTVKKSKVVVSFSNFDFAFPSIHAEDVVRAAIHLSKLDSTVGEDYMIDDDSQNTVIDVMRGLAEVFDKPFYLLPPVPVSVLRTALVSGSYIFKFLSDNFGIKKPIEEEFTLMFGYNMRYSNKKLKSTGFQFKFPKFQDGMKETIKWYQEVGLL